MADEVENTVSRLTSLRALLPDDRRAWLLLGLRLALILALFLELFVTAYRQRPDLLHPDVIGSDPSNYFAAALRLNVGHNLYGPLLPGDLLVPGYPAKYAAPLLSPPLVAVLWRVPAALLGDASMVLFWLGSIALVVLFTVWFALRGRPVELLTIALILAAGLPITLLVGLEYPYAGYNSPLSFAALSGNINAYLLALLVVVWWGASARHDRLSGIAAALATALKLGPVVLLWWFVVQHRWKSVAAFVAGLVAFGLVGLLFAGPSANLDYARLAVGGAVHPQDFAFAVMLRTVFHVRLATASLITWVVLAAGMVAMFALRRRPRASFAVAIAATIFSSPIVLAGNLALLLAIAAPWIVDVVADETVPAVSPGRLSGWVRRTAI